jgi:hypothetical protein
VDGIEVLLFALWLMIVLIYLDIRVMVKRLNHPLILVQRVTEVTEKKES